MRDQCVDLVRLMSLRTTARMTVTSSALGGSVRRHDPAVHPQPIRQVELVEIRPGFKRR
jgi:hypothetical protein